VHSTETLQPVSETDVILSVVVCTYNRVELLERLLHSLSAVQADPDRFEVIVVDNNSTDDTSRVAESGIVTRSRFTYVAEERQGLSYARNRGWQEACGVYVAYLDDECTVPENWISMALELIREPAADVFGGPYFGSYLTTPPFWWKSSYESYQLSDTARFLNDGEYIRGANLFIKRSVLASSDGFDADLGMTGGVIAYGEESEWQRRYRKTTEKPTVFYDPHLFVYHLVRKEKYDPRYMLRSRFAGGRHIYSVFWARSTSTRSRWRISLLAEAIFTAARLVFGFAWRFGIRDRRKYPHIQNYMYEMSFYHVQHLGFLFERFLQT